MDFKMGLLAHMLLWTSKIPQTEHTKVGFMGIKINV